MDLKSAVKKEPLAAFSLGISILVAVFGSPIFLDRYFGPKVVVTADFKQTDDPRCAPFRLFIRNEGTRAAENVFILYDPDFFTLRGDITGYYSGDEPLLKVRKRVDYVSNIGEIRIPKLAPGQEQEFRYIEEIEDSQSYSIRQRLIQDGDKRILYFPRIVQVGHDKGIAKLLRINDECEHAK